MAESESVGAPADTVDVTTEVNELKDQIHDLFQGQATHIIMMAIGSALGDSAPDQDWLKMMLYGIADTATQVFSATQQAHAPNEGSVH